MLGSLPFYHETTKKVVVAFGHTFSKLKIQRTNNEGSIEQIIDVPISFGNQEKWYRRYQEEKDLDKRVLISLPRIGFEIVNFQYDASRKLNKFNQIRPCLPNEGGEYLALFTPVPYTLTFNLYIYTKTSDDMYQIVEQILPYFTPQYNMTINMIPSMGIVQDLPVTIKSVNLNDSYEGPMSQRREVIATLTFDVKTEYFGGANNITGEMISKVITKIDPQSGNIAREVDVTAVGTPDSYTTIEEMFDIPRPIG